MNFNGKGADESQKWKRKFQSAFISSDVISFSHDLLGFFAAKLSGIETRAAGCSRKGSREQSPV